MSEYNFWDINRYILRKSVDGYKGMTEDDYIRYFASRTNEMFEYEGVPEEIPLDEYEMMLQLGGSVVIKKVNGKWYAFNAGLGGEMNAYYRPTIAVVANPYLRYTESLKIDEDCILIRNDISMMGLYPIFRKFAQSIYENDVSLRIANINMRLTSLISAGDDKTYQSAVKYIKDIVDGKLGVIAESQVFDGVKLQAGMSGVGSNYISQLIELRQYNLAQFYQEIGLQMNYNMKRESLSEAETQTDVYALEPLVDHMLKCRQKDWDKFNKKYGYNVKVKFNSAWYKEFKEREILVDEVKEENGSEEETEKEVQENE